MIKYYSFDVQKQHSNPDIATPEVGFSRGNMFNNEYIPYKNHQVLEVVALTEKEMLLNKIQKFAFAAHDLNLYLDVNPNDQELIDLYVKYNKEHQKHVEIYESKYGPLNVMDITEGASYWQWIMPTWPWEGKNV